MLSVFLTFFMMAAAWAVMSDEDFAKLCEKGTAKEIRAALQKGANPNAKDDNAVTALMVQQSITQKRFPSCWRLEQMSTRRTIMAEQPLTLHVGMQTRVYKRC